MIYQKKKKKQWDQGPLFVNYLEQILFVLLRLGQLAASFHLVTFVLCSLRRTLTALILFLDLHLLAHLPSC